jgi:hypothetical protein
VVFRNLAIDIMDYQGMKDPAEGCCETERSFVVFLLFSTDIGKIQTGHLNVICKGK